jgi:glutamyl-tRNA reductase
MARDLDSSIKIGVVGASFKETSIETREKLTKNVTFEVLGQFKKDNEELFKDDYLEIVLLSTCNRTEIYFASPNLPVARNICSKILGTGMPVNSKLHAYEYLGEEAAAHLCYVASGLDSLVAGEAQILYQVRGAARTSKDLKLSGQVLSKLFLKAYSTGKEVRQRHTLLTNGFKNSISLSVANLITDYFRDRPNPPNVLIVGSGKMAKLADSSFDRERLGRLIVASRRISVGGIKADRLIQISEIGEALVGEDIDVLIGATSSPDYVVTPEIIKRYVGSSKMSKELLIIDISIPRSIDPAVHSEFPSIRLINLDDLKGKVTGFEAESVKSPEVAAELRSARRLIESKSAEFMNWLDERSGVTPVMDQLRRKAELIRSEEFDNALSRLGNLNPEEREVVRKMSERIITRFLHDPALKMKTATRNGEMERSKEYAELLKLLFSLDTEKEEESAELVVEQDMLGELQQAQISTKKSGLGTSSTP